MNRSTIPAFATLMLAALAFPADSPAQAPASGGAEGRQYALLIGVEKYEKARPLVFTLNDVKTIAKTLRDRNGVNDGILSITDDATNPRHRPTRAAMIEEIPRWLAKIGPKDRLLVYFSGHGFKDPAGKLYLAPIDVDPEDPAATGLPVEWFRRQIADCKADFKLLVLDACHSGTEKGEEKGSDVPSESIVGEFKGLDRVATLASSTGAESSQIWDDKQMSLYSYWFNQAIKGHADVDGSGSVDIDEISNYVYKNVLRTAKAHFPRKQTPVRSVRVGLEGTPVVVKVNPSDLKTPLNDIAEQLALAAEDRKLKKVGVLQFSGRGDVGELIGANYGTLGQFCSDWMEKRLMAESGGDFEVSNGSVLQAALKKEKFGLDDLANPERMKRLSAAMNGLPSLANGVFLSRVGRVVSIQCRLVETGGDELMGSAGGSALLNESEWAMLGRSASLSSADLQPEMPRMDVAPKDQSEVAISRLDAKSQEIHPMANPNFEFPVRIFVDGKERAGVAKGNVWVVPLHKGERYEIYAYNKSGRPVCLRLLVDGLNTLPDPEMVPTKGVVTTLWGQHINLADARHWVLDPADPLVKDFPMNGKVWCIPGFVTETGANGNVKQFIMASAEQSLAAKRKFTDDLGLITAAFYEPRPKRRSGGTMAGPDEAVKIREDAKLYPGALRAVVNIRYVDADDPASSDSIESIQGTPTPPAPTVAP